MNVLVTGAAGYIGSHAALRLLECGHRVVAVDDLSRGHAAVFDRLAAAADDPGRVVAHVGDLGDRAAMVALMRDHGVQVVMHFGAKAYVGESVDDPLTYYRANTAAAIELLCAMREANVDRFIFSSTCASYGEPDAACIPITEALAQQPINPYGRSKLMVETVLRDAVAADSALGVIALRYFNVAGADPDGRLGEDHDPETHLIPIALQVALGQREALTIFGSDYDTPDGTCVRDYVHVTDLVDAHLRALDVVRPGHFDAFNIGIGTPYSVRDVVASVERVTGRTLRVERGERRAGDPPTLYADATRARQDLGWTPAFTDLDDIVRTAWAWFEAQPAGYDDADALARFAH